MPMAGMMPQQQQMGFGGGLVGPTPPFSEMTSPTSAAKQTLQKKADQAFADLGVFKWISLAEIISTCCFFLYAVFAYMDERSLF